MCQNNNEFSAEQLKKKCTVVRLRCCTKIKNFFRENSSIPTRPWKSYLASQNITLSTNADNETYLLWLF